MDIISLNTKDRDVFGKKVKKLRREGFIPAHIFGNKMKSEHITVYKKEFLPILKIVGETGLIKLKTGDEKSRLVMIRGLQRDPIKSDIVHIDFYQVNLKEKVKVPVPVILIGEEPESVHKGEAIVLQTLNEIEVEALPTDLVEKIEVDITPLQAVDDAIMISQLNYDSSKITILQNPEDVVVKLAPAITEEMKKLMEEQALEAAAVAEQATDEGEEVPSEGKETKEGGEEEIEEKVIVGEEPSEASSEEK